MDQVQLRRTYLAVAVFATIVFGFLGFGYAFGADLTCTNHFNCTMDSCPSVCDRATQGFAINSLGQLGLFAGLVATANSPRHHPPAWSLVAAANLSVVVAAVSALITQSSTRW